MNMEERSVAEIIDDEEVWDVEDIEDVASGSISFQRERMINGEATRGAAGGRWSGNDMSDLLEGEVDLDRMLGSLL